VSNINSRWRKGAQRYSSDRTVESVQWVRNPEGGRRLVRKAVSEVLFVNLAHELPGWRKGARLRKI
jgi:hypothetical protein